MTHDPSMTNKNLQEDLSRLQDQIRNDPANVKHRIYLFQLLCLLGEWDRALTQLNVLQEMDAAMVPMVGTYREAIHNEVLRGEIFSGKRSPLIFGEPGEWTALIVEALRLTAEEKYPEADALRGQAFDKAPTSGGTINGAAFEWLADADSRLGPIFEVIINGRYTWVPVNNIKKIEIEKPTDMRDLVWLPANFTWANGGELVALIPTRYPETEKSGDTDLMLSRKTEWIEASESTFIGRGQRIIATDNEEYPLMDIRLIEFDSAAGNGQTGSDMEKSDG